ncbi:MAG: hypothetical protein JXJ19_00215 [Elusimicrobia bacterium]|nr:hypothetical protein [Elusimicrobiota bacterium]
MTTDNSGYVTVTAEGTADIKKAGVAEATDVAYMDAQRKAIETALGKLYSARTVVESGRFIDQTIMADVKGYIKRWEKLGDPAVQDYPGTSYKIVKVQIKADIGLDKLKEDTTALDQMQKRLGRPDIAVVVSDANAKQTISSKLKDKDFTVIDLGSQADVLAAAADKNAELLIDGKVTLSEGKKIMEGVDMKSYQATITLEAVNTASAESIAQAAGSGAYPHIDADTGKAGAANRAAETAADQLIEKLLVVWEDVLNNGSGIYLKVSGLTLNNEADFGKLLERYLRGVKEIHAKGLQDGIFTYKIMYLGTAKQMAKEVSEIQGNFKVNVTGYRANTVTAQVK